MLGRHIGRGVHQARPQSRILNTPRIRAYAPVNASSQSTVDEFPSELRSTQQRRHAWRAESRRGEGGFGMTLYALAFTTIGAGATWYGMTRNGLGLFSDEESLTRFTPGDEQAHRVEKHLQSHPFTAELRKRPELIESRPHMKLPLELRERSLTGGTLLGPGKVPVPTLVWTDEKGTEITALLYVGDSLSGHKGIVHGGFLATILDEGLARCCMRALPHQIGVTANLNIDYRKPMPADSYVALRAKTVKVEGRKGWVKGRLESLPKNGEKPTVFAEATGLFVSPKYAAMLPKIS